MLEYGLYNMKLHLGCGQVYLKGYTNIDYPAHDHTIQQRSKADIETDLTKLNYGKGTIDEVRLHHVFEHFPRAQAIALAASWASWLKSGGLLRVEVPDFKTTAQAVLDDADSMKSTSVGMRHIFGSNEAHWAYHYDGWYQERFDYLLPKLGFGKLKFNNSEWKGTYNIEVQAIRTVKELNRKQTRAVAEEYLRFYLVDRSEEPLFDVWMREFDEQVERSWGK